MTKTQDFEFTADFYFHGLYIGRIAYEKESRQGNPIGNWIVWAGARNDNEADLDYGEATANATIAAFRDEIEDYGYAFGDEYTHEDVESSMDGYDADAGFEVY